MILSIIIGLSIWFVIPILLENKFKKKKNKAQKSIGYSLTYKSQAVKYSKMK